MTDQERWIFLGTLLVWALGMALAALWRSPALSRFWPGRCEPWQVGQLERPGEADARARWPVERADWVVAGLVAGWLMLNLLMALLAAPVPAATDPAAAKQLSGDQYAGQLALGVALQLPLLLVVVAMLAFRPGRSAVSWLGLRPRWTLLLVGLLLVPVMILLTYAMQAGALLLQEKLGIEPRPQEQLQMMQQASTPLLMVMLTLTAGVFAPLAEELLFRGYFYPVLRSKFGPAVAVMASGLFFGLVHVHLAGLLTLSLFGMLLALLFERFRTIWVPIATHAAFNGITLWVLFSSTSGK